jgi:hypothetical protein
MSSHHVHHHTGSRYTPAAIYYEEADSLEYVRADVPNVYRRVDQFLTLVLSMETRKPIGFRLKGFRNFYLRHLEPKYHLQERHFLLLIDVLQDALSEDGEAIVQATERSVGYRQALEIAQVDNVKIDEFPRVA